MGMRRVVSSLVFVGLVMGLASMAMAADETIDGNLRVRGNLRVEGQSPYGGMQQSFVKGSLVVNGTGPNQVVLGEYEAALVAQGISPSIILQDYSGGQLTVRTQYGGAGLDARGGSREIRSDRDVRIYAMRDVILRAGFGGQLRMDTQGNVTIGPAAAGAPGGYFQITKVTAGVPPLDDCKSDDQRGRMTIDTQRNRLYVCNGKSRGWDSMQLIH